MTTFVYKIILDDGEIIMLKAALNFMIANCEKEMISGPKSPYWAHKIDAENVLKRLNNDISQTS